MRKILLIIGVCVLLAGMPAMTGISVPKMKNLKTLMPAIEGTASTKDDLPWAAGTFNGTWGYDLLGAGKIPIPLGNLSGYYAMGYHWTIRVGRFLVDFAYYDGTDVARLEGWFFGPYLVGNVWKIDDANNQTAFVGIGQYNETSSEFAWRLMGFTGPTFYMWGTSAEFE